MAKPKPLVLIVEDDRQIAQLVADHLEMSGMMTQVFNRAAGVQKFLTTHFANLMLLDVNLPDQNGFDLVHELRNNNLQVPVIFLTGDDSEVQKVKGFQVGGDDYVTKPFSFPEL
ncbi:response regulator, partial [Arthrospira platensis SPKY1]|nr:response regulator [Arthrospira platensis SPKY1]